MKYAQKLTSLIENLEKTGVKFYKKHIGGIASLQNEAYFQRLEKKKNISLNPDIKKIYGDIDEVSIIWEYQKDTLQFNGFFVIETFGRAFLNTSEIGEDKLWTDDDDEIDKEIMKKHSIFEYMPGMDYYITIYNDLETGIYQMYYVPEGHVNFKGADTLPKIPLTIEQYLDLMISCYGCDGVRHHLHKPEFYQNPFEICQELQELKTLFPDLNLILPMI
jgi:hypothetical protein